MATSRRCAWLRHSPWSQSSGLVSEPTRGIDVGAKALVLDALKRFNREYGVTVVVISSELEELRQTCDRIAIVSGGKIAGILPASEPSEAFGALMVSQVI